MPHAKYVRRVHSKDISHDGGGYGTQYPSRHSGFTGHGAQFALHLLALADQVDDAFQHFTRAAAIHPGCMYGQGQHVQFFDVMKVGGVAQCIAKVVAQLDTLLSPHDDVAQWFLQILCSQLDGTFDVTPRCQTSDDLINEEGYLVDHLVDLLLVHDLRDQDADHTQYHPPKNRRQHAPLLEKDDAAADGQHQQKQGHTRLDLNADTTQPARQRRDDFVFA
jgi:hypothetical protein